MEVFPSRVEKLRDGLVPGRADSSQAMIKISRLGNLDSRYFPRWKKHFTQTKWIQKKELTGEQLLFPVLEIYIKLRLII